MANATGSQTMLWVAKFYPTGTQEESNSNFELLSSSNIYYKDFDEKKKKSMPSKPK